MNDVNASDLPPVDAVEIILLDAVKGEHPVRVEGELAEKIANLWRQLPFAGQKRCHIPPFALRFFQNNQLVLHASVCWMCNNIWIIEDNNRRTIEFDGNSDVSRQLFQLLKECFPNQTIEEFYGDD